MILNKIPKDKFLLIAGPCAIEGEEISIKIAEKLSTQHGGLGKESND